MCRIKIYNSTSNFVKKHFFELRVHPNGYSIKIYYWDEDHNIYAILSMWEKVKDLKKAGFKTVNDENSTDTD